MNLDPRIGMLNGGKFYAFVNGYAKPEFTGTLNEVEIALGVRQKRGQSGKPSSKAGKLRSYVVTVTPRVVSYAGNSSFGEYTVRVDATSHSEAITKARRAYNEEAGRYGVRTSYRAKIAEQ